MKFVDVDIDEIRGRLKKAGAELKHPMRLMRRVLIEQPEHEQRNAFIRVRDEGDRVTLTYKEQKSATLHGVKEIEVTVGDFEKTVELLSLAGWKYKTRQESRRETWKLNDVEVVIDERPWVPPYIEIEGPSEHAVRDVADKLKCDWNSALYGNEKSLYQHYFPNMTVRGLIDIPSVRFEDPIPKEFLGKKS